MRRILIAGLFCLSASAAVAEPPEDLGKRVTETYIRPSVAHFANSAAALTGAMDRLCHAPSEARFDTVRALFGTLVDSWFRIYFLRFGPLVDDNRFERIFFWPDPRGVILRQVSGILGNADPTALDPDLLAQKSVAVQGLPALEYALYGSGSQSILEGTADGKFRCDYALSTSVRIAETAAELVRAWSPDSDYAKDFTDPGPENDLYRSQTEVAAEVVKALAGGMTFLSDVVIAPFLGKEPEQARASRAPFWRSNHTLPALQEGVRGMRDFYEATDFAGNYAKSDEWIDGSLRLEMRTIDDTLGNITEPLEEAVAPGPGREALVYTVIALKSLHSTVDTRLASAVGVSVGFNALDGD